MKPYKLTIKPQRAFSNKIAITLKKRKLFFFWTTVYIELYSYKEWCLHSSIYGVNTAFRFLFDHGIDERKVIIEDLVN